MANPLRTGDRVLVITERYYPEEFLINDLVSSWIAQGLRVTVLTQVPSYPRDRLFPGYPNRLICSSKEHGTRVIRFCTILGYRRSVVRKVLGYFSFMFCSAVVALAVGWRYRYVFVYHTGPLTQALGATLLNHLFGKRTSIWTQDIWPDAVYAYGLPRLGTGSALLRQFVRFIYGGMSSIAVSSPGFVDRLSPYSASRPVLYIPQWPPPELLSSCGGPSASLGPDKTHFTFAGNLGTMQNLRFVLESFTRASTRRSDLQLNLVGDGNQRWELEEWVRQNAAHNVKFWGRVPLQHVMRWLHASDFLVLSLIADPVLDLTLPAKFQAYLVAARPILVLAGGEAARLVTEKGLGVTASTGRVGDAADGFLALAAMPRSERRRVGEIMIDLASEQYDRSVCQAHLTELLKGIPLSAGQTN